MTVTIAVLPGDGIGPEITQQAVRVLRAVAQRYALALLFEEALVGGAAYDATGHPLPPETLALCRRADAVLFGAVGGPKWDSVQPPTLRPELGALLPLRKALGLFANLRPARLYPALAEASALKAALIQEGLDILVVRELTGGIYFGHKERDADGRRAVDTCVYTTEEIERIARVGFEAAQKRQGRLCSVDKANVLETSRLWREVVTHVGAEYPHVALSHMLVDNCAMQLVRNPGQFDVIVTENMFGDILSDEASMLTGSLGMLPSASLGAGRAGLYEPIHGSAPDIAGQGIANPLAAILSAALLLRYSLLQEAAARQVERAVEATLAAGYRTADIARPGETPIRTDAMGDYVLEALATLS
ncbi:MAG TPA: 3-isopropylmalate dehydrogenase [Chthonomonadaceae bacterium]|nr:3-isopropylmalate dehydrogenase [Chthonomonadaceae bacterium]